MARSSFVFTKIAMMIFSLQVMRVIQDYLGSKNKFQVNNYRFSQTRLMRKLIQFIVLLGLISCLTPIDLPVEIKGGKLVVSGQISTISDQNIIELGTTATTDRLPNPLGGAIVKVVDDMGESIICTEDPIRLGVYTFSNFTGIEGRSYQVEITLPNGKTYKSAVEKMPKASQLDLVDYEIVTEGVVDSDGKFQNKNFYKIYANSTIPKNSFMRWVVREAFLLSPTDFPDPFGLIPAPCFIDQNADPQRIVIFDGSTISSSSINRQLIASREIDWTFHEKHYFTSYQSTLTKEAFDYWRKVNILANQVGSIFDAPPAEITGNIVNEKNPDEKIFGYFQAVNQIFQRKDFYESDLPFSLSSGRCDFTGSLNDLDYPPRCIDCSRVRNSSYNRPDWF